MNIGQLDRRITLERYEATQDAYGQPVGEWLTVATVWANKKFRQGQEVYDAEQQTAVQKVEWLLRYRADVTTELRLVEQPGGEVFQIDSVAEVGRRTALLLASYSRGEEKPAVSGL